MVLLNLFRQQYVCIRNQLSTLFGVDAQVSFVFEKFDVDVSRERTRLWGSLLYKYTQGVATFQATSNNSKPPAQSTAATLIWQFQAPPQQFQARFQIMQYVIIG